MIQAHQITPVMKKITINQTAVEAAVFQLTVAIILLRTRKNSNDDWGKGYFIGRLDASRQILKYLLAGASAQVRREAGRLIRRELALPKEVA